MAADGSDTDVENHMVQVSGADIGQVAARMGRRATADSPRKELESFLKRIKVCLFFHNVRY